MPALDYIVDYEASCLENWRRAFQLAMAQPDTEWKRRYRRERERERWLAISREIVSHKPRDREIQYKRAYIDLTTSI